MEHPKVYMGKVIRSLRNEKGLKSEELAKMVVPEKSAGAITCWERGESEPSSEYIVQLSNIFEVDAGVFYQTNKGAEKNMGAFEVAKLNALGECFSKMNTGQRDAVLAVARAMVD